MSSPAPLSGVNIEEGGKKTKLSVNAQNQVKEMDIGSIHLVFPAFSQLSEEDCSF